MFFDTPPIVPVTDFVVLAKKLDAIIIISRVRVVTRAIVKEAITKLSIYRQKVLGILNGVIRKGSYYYYYK